MAIDAYGVRTSAWSNLDCLCVCLSHLCNISLLSVEMYHRCPDSLCATITPAPQRQRQYDTTLSKCRIIISFALSRFGDFCAREDQMVPWAAVCHNENI